MKPCKNLKEKVNQLLGGGKNIYIYIDIDIDIDI